MARPKGFRTRLEEYLEDKSEDGLRPRTLMEYKRVNLRCFKMLVDADMETSPLRMGRPEVNYIRSQIPVNRGNFRNQQYHLDLFTMFLRWCGNQNIKPIRWPEGVRTNADWLTEEQMEVIRLSVRNDPELSMLFHLAGDLALRRCEVGRLVLEDFDRGVIHVTGKGPGAGKPRDIIKHPETDNYLADYLTFREDIIRDAIRRDPFQEIPDGLMVHLHPYHRTMGLCKNTALDRRLDRLRKASGIDFRGYHTLRRTSAREWWHSGTKIETISEILGHKDIKTTRKYLGITIDDQAEAHQLRLDRQRQLRAELLKNGAMYQLRGSDEMTG